MLKANNLSDVANVAASRANLGTVAKAGDTFTGSVVVSGAALYSDAGLFTGPAWIIQTYHDAPNHRGLHFWDSGAAQAAWIYDYSSGDLQWYRAGRGVQLSMKANGDLWLPAGNVIASNINSDVHRALYGDVI
jgi:hypothetical protein